MDKSKQIAKIAYHALDEKKAEDIKIIEINKLSIVADYFIIANGTNTPHVDALVDSVEDVLYLLCFFAVIRKDIFCSRIYFPVFIFEKTNDVFSNKQDSFIRILDRQIAGLLHDCAKEYSDADLLQKCMELELPISKHERIVLSGFWNAIWRSSSSGGSDGCLRSGSR